MHADMMGVSNPLEFRDANELTAEAVHYRQFAIADTGTNLISIFFSLEPKYRERWFSQPNLTGA